MIIKDTQGRFSFNANCPNEDFEGDAIQVIDDNSELGQKILSMLPHVELVYEEGQVVDCKPVVLHKPPTEFEKLRADVDYALILLEG